MQRCPGIGWGLKGIQTKSWCFDSFRKEMVYLGHIVPADRNLHSPVEWGTFLSGPVVLNGVLNLSNRHVSSLFKSSRCGTILRNYGRGRQVVVSFSRFSNPRAHQAHGQPHHPDSKFQHHPGHSQCQVRTSMGPTDMSAKEKRDRR